MASLFPREEHAEALFHRILSNPGAEQQLYETFCMEQENASFEDGGGAECSFAKALLQAYENRDISALTIALCNNTMFDLLRTAYLIPYRFHGKNGGNPRLLTDANGEVREEYRNAVSARELRKFHDIYRQHRVRRSTWPMAVICATSTPRTCRCGRCIRRPAAAC